MEQKKHRKAVSVLLALAMSLTAQTAAFSPGSIVSAEDFVDDIETVSFEPSMQYAYTAESEDCAFDDTAEQANPGDAFREPEDSAFPLVDSEFYAYAGSGSSVITKWEAYDQSSKIKFTYSNSYSGSEPVTYGFLCYRGGTLSDDMTVGMAGIESIEKNTASGTIIAADRGYGVYLRTYIKVNTGNGYSYIYGSQVYVRHNELINQNNNSTDNNDPVESYYLTPQMFKDKNDPDDTASFQKLFAAAYYLGVDSSSSGNPGWRRCKGIYIPSGDYIISDTIISYKTYPYDPVNKKYITNSANRINYARFEVRGDGRESTRIKFTGNGILFDDVIPDSAQGEISEYDWTHPLFGFSTFRDISFWGNNTNTFLTMRDTVRYQKNADGSFVRNNGRLVKASVSGNDGPQRMQFISCEFKNWNRIIKTEHSTCQLSEVTFAFCNIHDCGTDSNPCELFHMDCSQAVNWRFDYTDVESIKGTIVFYEEGASIYFNGGSIIMNQGTAFVFKCNTLDGKTNTGQSGSPHLMCIGSHFEIRYDENSSLYDGSPLNSTLLETNAMCTPNVIFRSCKMGTSSNKPKVYLKINGGCDILFDNCYDLASMKLWVNSSYSNVVKPRLRFINCNDVSADSIMKYAHIETNAPNHNDTNLRITIDKEYDFYLRKTSTDTYNNATYYQNVTGLQECRQPVNLRESNDVYYDYITIPADSSKTISAKPYGFVKYVEITVPKSDVNTPIKITVSDGKTLKALGSVTIDPSKSGIYKIEVADYADQLDITLEHTTAPSSSSKISMNAEIVKF